MSPIYAKTIIVVSNVALVAIRAPHGRRSRGVRVAKSHQGPREIALLTFVWITFFLPLVWAGTSVLAFADYPLNPMPFAAGWLCLVFGLWLFARSHADLGTNWSVTLEVREGHRLITHGVYQYVRHPMYSSL